MKKNILVVDDSALLRRVICDIIESGNSYVVSDVCKNGNEAYELIKKKKFDAVIMDIVMPGMSGLEVLEKLKEDGIKATVIVASTLTTSSASAETLRALELDAVDFIAKPSNLIEARGEDFKDQLLKILDNVTAEKQNIVVRPSGVTVEAATTVRKEREHKGAAASKKLVALACSTGGPKALNEVIPKLPENLDAPVLVVQHMPEGFTKLLAEKLDGISKLRVKEAEHGEVVKKGCVYIAPGGKHMLLQRAEGGNHRIRLSNEPPRDALKPCADIMYESLVSADYEEITCVVLTGMGSDGKKGIATLDSKRKVYVITQDAQSCVVYGMPKATFEAGLSDEVVALGNVADAIRKNVGGKKLWM